MNNIFWLRVGLRPRDLTKEILYFSAENFIDFFNKFAFLLFLLFLNLSSEKYAKN